MKLTIDIGNTCIKLVAFDGDTPIESCHAEHDEPYKIVEFCSRHNFTKGIWSTVKKLSTDFTSVIENLPFPTMQLVSGKTPVPVSIGYEPPTSLGSDRLAAIVGAWTQQPFHDILVIDVGTCITFDIISSKGIYMGGNISPGPKMRFRALNTFTSALPMVERKGLSPRLGTTTETAIRSGVINGIRLEIEGYIKEFRSKYPHLLVYLTGGIHIDLHNSEKMCIFADEYLVPKGLNGILQYNEASFAK